MFSTNYLYSSHCNLSSFYYSFEFYKEGGPVFIQIGGEGAASDRFLYDGAWIKWAMQNKAALFILEHRYYGLSRPTVDLSTKNLQWLSSRFVIVRCISKIHMLHICCQCLYVDIITNYMEKGMFLFV